MKNISLGLQGGGSFGAFTKGCLIEMLDKEIEFDCVSGASAGTINACLLLSGKSLNDSKDKLDNFWNDIAQENIFALLFQSTLENVNISENFKRMMIKFTQGHNISVNPLARAIERYVNFDRIRNSKTKLFVSTTKVANGKNVIFTNKEISIEHILASCCLPLMFDPIKIKGEYYWDGGFSLNPPLLKLFEESKSKDIALIQLNPTNIDRMPSSRRLIMDRMNEINFNSSLSLEIEIIEKLKKMEIDNNIKNKKYSNKDLSIITNNDLFNIIPSNYKLFTNTDFLEKLSDLGQKEAEIFIYKKNNENKIKY